MPSFGIRLHRATLLIICSLVFCLTRGLVMAQTHQLTGTLPEDYLPELRPLLDQALKQSPQMLLRQIDIFQRKAGVYDADHERWPGVGGDIRYDSTDTAVSSNSSTQSRDSGLFYSLSADQALFHWGAIKHRGDIARIQVAISEKNYAEAYRMLAVEMRKQYTFLIAMNAGLRQARYNLDLKEADLKAARDKVAKGTLAPGDVTGREWDYQDAKLAFDRRQLEFDGERRKFARLFGQKDFPVEQIPVAIPEPRYDAALAKELLDEMTRDDARGTFQAQVADLEIRKADLSYRIAKVRLLPKFNASIAHSRESSTTASVSQVSTTAITRDTIEVRGNWTIFDGFATKGAKLDAIANRRFWEKQRQIDADAALDEAQQLGKELALDAQAMGYAEQRRSAAEAMARRNEEDMKAGRTSQTTVDSSVNDLRRAESDVASARATFLTTWSAFVSRVTDDPILSNLPSSYVRANR